MIGLEDFTLIERILIIGLPLVIAVTLHEAAHGYVAKFFGDLTAEYAGRLTLNPIPHIDPVGTLLLPGLLFISGAPFLFGYAKPVPVNFRNLRNPKQDMIWVAAAGPGMNILLAVMSALGFYIVETFPDAMHDFLYAMLSFSIGAVPDN